MSFQAGLTTFLFILFFQQPADLNNNSLTKTSLLASQSISLQERHANSFVNDVFRDNILLNLSYMRGDVSRAEDIDWDKVQKAFEYKFTLLPNEAFAFHEDVFEEYEDRVVFTSKAHFNLQEGFRYSGYLAGDGVCHLASLIYWVAKEADIDTYAPANHNFATIPQVKKEYGVSIYSKPGAVSSNALQNLYITNNKENPIEFIFVYDGTNLKLSIIEINEPISKDDLSTPFLN